MDLEISKKSWLTKKHLEHKEMKAWYGVSSDPNKFKAKSATKKLKN